MDVHENLFAEYLDQRSVAWKAFPDLPTKKKPDFAVEVDGTKVVVEVEGLGGDFYPDQGYAALPPESNRIKNKIGAGAEQLRELAETGWPLVIVIASASGSNFPLSSRVLREAIQGEAKLVMRDFDGEQSHSMAEVPRGGKARNHLYLSAIAALYRSPFDQDVPGQARRTQERIACVDVITFDDGRSAAKLPARLFAGEYDRRWEWDGETFTGP
jgi:hypothetical protein